MNEGKVKELKWNLKKVRGSILHFSLKENIKKELKQNI